MEKTFLELFAEIIEADTPLAFEISLEDLDSWDSVAKLSMISMVEDEFGVVISQKDLKSFITIRDIVEFIGKLMK